MQKSISSIKRIGGKTISPLVSGLTILVMMLQFFVPVAANAVSVGPSSPSAVVDDTSVGTQTWSNVSNVQSSDNNYSTVSLGQGQISHYVKATGFGFAIPNGPGTTVINGITVKIERKASEDTHNGQNQNYINDNVVKIVKNSSIAGNNKASSTRWGTSDSTPSYGNSTDLWNETWSADDINNSNFGVVVSAKRNGTDTHANTAFIDAITITIDYTYTAPAVTPNSNPSISQSCGADMVLVLDSSDSMSDNDIVTVKNDAMALVDSLMPATPTKIGVIDFDTDVVSSLSPTANKTDVLNAINSIGHTTSTEYTNWEAALASADSMVGLGGLVVIITDGNPTRSSGPLSDLDDAIVAANAIKTGGTRILAIGINSSGSSGGLNLDNLKAISGTQVIPPGTITDINQVDVYMGDISELGSVLTNLTTALCGGTITVTKMVGQTPTSGWTFDINNTQKTTGSDGKAIWNLNNGTYDITETVQPGYSFLSASCTGDKGTQDLVLPKINGVQVGKDDIISCTFYNTSQCVPSAEICDGVDNDCDGLVDEGIADQPADNQAGLCSGNVLTCSGGQMVPADDNYIPVAETCDGSDNNCDGQVDEGVQSTFFQDADNDTYGNGQMTTQACSAPTGYVSNSTDCNDSNSAINPGAAEVCNGVDDNCNAQTDEGGVCSVSSYYCDNDQDTYVSSTPSGTCDTFECVPSGCTTTQGSDCNDSDAAINPGATEICNGIDDNCSGQVDEGVQSIFFQDSDTDTYGNASMTTQACSVPQGYVENGTDCNDSNASIYPGAQEVCNGVDDNCNGQVDEGVLSTFYQDSDSDTYGNASVTTQSCSAPTGYVSNSTDCNDENAAVNPGATEVCGNGIDDDCDGFIDNADTDCKVCTPEATQSCETGTPGICSVGVKTCNSDGFWGLCVQTNQPITEICSNQLDDDCDGQIDNCQISTGSIAGYKWNDPDQDGLFDSGDVELPGWNIFIDFNHDEINSAGDWQTTTDRGGFYRFLNVPVGTYQICEIISDHSGWTTKNSLCQTVNVEKDVETQFDHEARADFFNYETTCTNRNEVIDSVPQGSLSTWEVHTFSYNPEVSYSEITSPYDSSIAAIQASAIGDTIINYCSNQDISKTYPVSGNTDTTDLKAYLGFTSTMDEYNFPYVNVVLYDNADTAVGSQIYYGNGVISGLYAQNAIDYPGSYTQLPVATGDATLDLSKMGVNINFSKVKIMISNYACIGQNSVTFDELRVVTQCSETQPVCGDGIKNGQEVCDGTDGVGAHQSCSQTCTLINLPYCGDNACNNEETCSSCSQDCGSCGGGSTGGGGGGGGGFIMPLSISNEKNESLNLTEAIVSWFTNLEATTRVIYDTVSHSTIGTSPNYGYTFSTTQDLSKVSFHTVSINGLTPGVTYYWRAVATQNGFAPEILGSELSFVAPAIQGETIVAGEEIVQAPSETPVSGPTEETQGQEGGEEGIVSDITTEEEPIETQTNATQGEENNQNMFLASIGNFLGNILGVNCAKTNDCCWRLALIMTVISGIYLFIRENDKNKKKRLGNWKKYYTDLTIGLIIVISLIAWLKCWWLTVPAALFILWMLKEKFMQK